MTTLIDLNFQGTPGTIAAFAFDTGDGLALVDTGPSSTLAALTAGLGRIGAALSDIRHILLTHIHLDHAGAAGTLLAQVPEARVYVHSRGAAHLQAPARLLASAAQIYGEQMDTLWGQMQPVAAGQMTVLEGGETLHIGALKVRPLYTPGHAVHHLAYSVGPDLYPGDVGGIRLGEQQSPRPPTPPPDIDLAAWAASIALLRSTQAQTLHLPHFGSYPQSAAHWNDLERNLASDSALVFRALERGEEAQMITKEFTDHLHTALGLEHTALGLEGPELPGPYALACPPWMSVQGLTRAWKRASARS